MDFGLCSFCALDTKCVQDDQEEEIQTLPHHGYQHAEVPLRPRAKQLSRRTRPGSRATTPSVAGNAQATSCVGPLDAAAAGAQAWWGSLPLVCVPQPDPDFVLVDLAASAKKKHGAAAAPRLQQHYSGVPDFSGDWICHAVDGDMEALMVALEVGWAKRSAAYLINYGVGIATRRIHHVGDDFVIEVDATPAVFVQRFRAGAGWQKTEGPEGEAWVDPVWESNAMLRVEQKSGDGSPQAVVRQFFDGNDLVVHMTAPGDVGAAWRFKLQ